MVVQVGQVESIDEGVTIMDKYEPLAAVVTCRKMQRTSFKWDSKKNGAWLRVPSDRMAMDPRHSMMNPRT